MNMAFLQNVLGSLDIVALNIHARDDGQWAVHARKRDRGFTPGETAPTITQAVTNTLKVCGYEDPAAGL